MSSKGKKHKRGDRGSTEEEISVAKKQNMEEASSETKKDDSTLGEDACESNEENEASLKEIMHLLQNVQQTLQEMRAESRNMADEMKELKASFNKQSTEINALKKALKEIEKVNVELN